MFRPVIVVANKELGRTEGIYMNEWYDCFRAEYMGYELYRRKESVEGLWNWIVVTGRFNVMKFSRFDDLREYLDYLLSLADIAPKLLYCDFCEVNESDCDEEKSVR